MKKILGLLVLLLAATPALGASSAFNIDASQGGIALGTTTAATNGIVLSGTESVTFPSGRKGTFTCTSGGTITISNTNMLAASNVVISLNAAGGTISTAPAMKTVTAATGFTVLCATSDTSTYNYLIMN